MSSERDKMLRGELYDPLDPELVQTRSRARDLCQDLNATREGQQDERRRILRQLFGRGREHRDPGYSQGRVCGRQPLPRDPRHLRERPPSGERDRLCLSGLTMNQSLLHIAMVVRDYDEALAFFCGKLHLTLAEDTYQPEQDKRWGVVAPPGSPGASFLLARAATPEQSAGIGRQTGGRVFLFLGTDDFCRDDEAMRAAEIKFVQPPKTADYGAVAVFEDQYGNLWDPVELAARQSSR